MAIALMNLDRYISAKDMSFISTAYNVLGYTKRDKVFHITSLYVGRWFGDDWIGCYHVSNLTADEGVHKSY
jgi:hypothetical protein